MEEKAYVGYHFYLKVVGSFCVKKLNLYELKQTFINIGIEHTIYGKYTFIWTIWWHLAERLEIIRHWSLHQLLK